MDLNYKNILIVRNDRLGEFLLSIPVMVVLKKKFPQAKISLVVKPDIKELALRIPEVDSILTWDSSKSHTLGERLDFLRNLKGRKFYAAFILNPLKEFHALTFLSGIPLRVGYNRKWGFLLNHKVRDSKSEGKSHEVDCNLVLIRALGIDFKQSDISFSLDIVPDDFPVKKIGCESRKFLVIHPWASNPEKEWSIVKFRDLILRLSAEFSYRIVIIGSTQEITRAEGFISGIEDKVVNLTGNTNLVELAAVLQNSLLLISNDSGPMHLAGVLGTPVAAIFRKSPVYVSAKRWGPVGENNVIIESDNIMDIEAKEVMDGIKKILK